MSDENIVDVHGYAFPQSIEEARTKVAAVYGGLTLRAWLAGQALAGAIVEGECHDFARLAEFCVAAADAMIERLKK